MAGGLQRVIDALLGVSAYEPLQDEQDRAREQELRERLGAGISRRPVTKTRWYIAELEAAVLNADTGKLRDAAKLWRAMRRDGVISGLLSTCTDGLVRLPKTFSGCDEQVQDLSGAEQSVFDQMCPPAELALLAADGRGLGVAIGELVPVRGRDYPVLVRLDPEWLRYSWGESRWYYSTAQGELAVTPGDGRWVLHVPGGRVAPWQNGLWYALAEAWIPKTHAKSYRSNWESKLANPARVAVAPVAATEEQAQSWFEKVMAWGVNTVFGMKPGYDVKLLESNGRGYEAFGETIKTSNEEIIIALAGQLVTTTGGTGFANADIHKSIRADIIKSIADGLAYTINTQCLPPWIVERWGVKGLEHRAKVQWDVAPPKDRDAEGRAMQSFAQGVNALRESLHAYGRDVDIAALLSSHGIPTVPLVGGYAAPPPAGEQAPAEAPSGESVDIYDPDGDGEPGEAPTDTAAQDLADKMTAEGVDRCEHGALNRCRLCGIERVRDFEREEDGTIVWKVIWRPISREASAA